MTVIDVILGLYQVIALTSGVLLIKSYDVLFPEQWTKVLTTITTPHTGIFTRWSFRREQRVSRNLTNTGDGLQENTMLTLKHTHSLPKIRFEFLNWIATDPLPRDQSQSQRLHEPDHLINTIDPMTGSDIEDVTHHPHLEDGNLTIYFETEATRRAFIEMPLNHPNRCLPYPATDEDDRGG